MSIQYPAITLSHSMGRGRGFFTGLAERLGVAMVMVWSLASGIPVSAADQPMPHTYADESWITISGTVNRVSADQFSLDYGDGAVLVEMDDGDRDADAYKLLSGDKVTVTGRIDDDMFETTSIEAASVYVENLGTTFFASSVDEDYREIIDSANVPPIVVARATLRGVVTEVNETEFMVNTGKRRVRVDVTQMSYNPLDDEGYQKISRGDRVHVIGKIDVDLFEGRRLEAESVITLYSR